MIFQNIDFHNVSCLTKDDRGAHIMHRLPLRVEEALSPGGQNANKVTTGVELRFKLLSDYAKIKFFLDTPENSATTLYVYRGSVLGGWKECSASVCISRGGYYTAYKRRPSQKNLSCLRLVNNSR